MFRKNSSMRVWTNTFLIAGSVWSNGRTGRGRICRLPTSAFVSPILAPAGRLVSKPPVRVDSNG